MYNPEFRLIPQTFPPVEFSPVELLSSTTLTGVYLVDEPKNPFMGRLIQLCGEPQPYNPAAEYRWCLPVYPNNPTSSLILSTCENSLIEISHSTCSGIAYTLRFHPRVFQRKRAEFYSLRQRISFDGYTPPSSSYELVELLEIEGTYGRVLAISVKEDGSYYGLSSLFYPPIELYIPLARLGPTLRSTHPFFASQNPRHYSDPFVALDTRFLAGTDISSSTHVSHRKGIFTPILQLIQKLRR